MGEGEGEGDGQRAGQGCGRGEGTALRGGRRAKGNLTGGGVEQGRAHRTDRETEREGGREGGRERERESARTRQALPACNLMSVAKAPCRVGDALRTARTRGLVRAAGWRGRGTYAHLPVEKVLLVAADSDTRRPRGLCLAFDPVPACESRRPARAGGRLVRFCTAARTDRLARGRAGSPAGEHKRRRALVSARRHCGQAGAAGAGRQHPRQHGAGRYRRRGKRGCPHRFTVPVCYNRSSASFLAASARRGPAAPAASMDARAGRF